MTNFDQSRFDELMSRYLDASLDGVEERELLQCLSDEEIALRFHEMTRLDSEIAGLLAGSVRDEVMVGLVWSDLGVMETPSPAFPANPDRTTVPFPVIARSKTNERTKPLFALVAVVAAMLGVTALYFFRAPAPTPPAGSMNIASVRGEVYFVGPSGQVSVRNGQPLPGDGTIKTVGADSRATLALTDGTEISLLGNTSFNAETASGKRRLFLDAGILRSVVSKQPEDVPLVFTTAEAVATVRGTELAIIEGNSSMYLVVLRGAVALRRSSGGPEVFINAGYYGHVEPRGEFHPWPIGRLPKTLREQLNIQD